MAIGARYFSRSIYSYWSSCWVLISGDVVLARLFVVYSGVFGDEGPYASAALKALSRCFMHAFVVYLQSPTDLHLFHITCIEAS